MGVQGFNVLSFKSKPGAKFTMAENAEAICAEWNGATGIGGEA